MAPKKQAPPKKSPRLRMVEAALQLAATRRWADVSLADIAAQAGFSLAELRDMVDEKADILAAYGRMLDTRVLENMGQGGDDADPRERLFDVLMERFDLMNDDRAALVSIMGSLCTDPKDLVIGMPHLGRSMAWMAESAGIDTSGPRGAARLAGLTCVYLAALRVWKDDESVDLAKTMAALDRYLDRAAQLAGTFGL